MILPYIFLQNFDFKIERKTTKQLNLYFRAIFYLNFQKILFLFDELKRNIVIFSSF